MPTFLEDILPTFATGFLGSEAELHTGHKSGASWTYDFNATSQEIHRLQKPFSFQRQQSVSQPTTARASDARYLTPGHFETGIEERDSELSSMEDSASRESNRSRRRTYTSKATGGPSIERLRTSQEQESPAMRWMSMRRSISMANGGEMRHHALMLGPTPQKITFVSQTSLATEALTLEVTAPYYRALGPEGQVSAKRVLWAISKLCTYVEFAPVLPPLVCWLMLYLRESIVFTIVFRICERSRQPLSDTTSRVFLPLKRRHFVK